MIPKQDPPDSNLDRQKRLLGLEDPNFGGGSYSNNSFSSSSSRIASAPIKVKSAAVQVPSRNASTTSDIQKQRELLGLGNVNLFGIGGSPMAETLAARQRSNR
jgi:hypothetical protein